MDSTKILITLIQMDTVVQEQMDTAIQMATTIATIIIHITQWDPCIHRVCITQMVIMAVADGMVSFGVKKKR